MIADLVYDVGFHEGQDTAYYLWKGFRVVAVEANPELVKAAQTHFSEAIASRRLVLVNAAIAEREGEARFWVCDSNTAWSSFDITGASRHGSPHHEVKVPTLPLARLLEEHGTPFCLKVDIEGSEGVCLGDLRKGDLPAFVSCEISGTDRIDQLSELGFRGFKVIDQHSHRPITSPPACSYRAFCAQQKMLHGPSLRFRIFRTLGGRRLLKALEERRRTLRGWRFVHGSSGPFGEDTPGAWFSAEEAKANYIRHANLMRNATEYKKCGAPYMMDVWCDVHARLSPPPPRLGGVRPGNVFSKSLESGCQK